MSLPLLGPLGLLFLGWLGRTFGADAAAPALVVYQPPHTKAEVGLPVNLSCTYNYTGKKNMDTVGQFFRGNSQKGQSAIEKCQSIGSSGSHISCNLSLTIESPRPADEDVYYCEVLMPTAGGIVEESGSGTKLSLYAQPSSMEIQLSSPLVSEHKATLNCKVSGFYPRNASIMWICSGTPVLPGSITEHITMNNEGTFSLLSQYTFSPMVKDNNAECVCLASHPVWAQTKKTSSTLSVSYGPIAVNVTSDSEVVTNSSVWVTNGYTLNLMCVADGNPRPKTQWLGGNIKGVHHADTLHIPAVQREHEGLYWCVAKNKYGELNTSITLLVSYSNSTNTDGHKALYSLAAIPLVLVLVTLIIFLQRKGQKNNALAGQGLQADGQEHYDDELAQAEGIIYAEPKRRKKKRKHQPTAPSVLDSSQLIYTDILFPQPPRSQTVTTNESMTIYSEVGKVRGHGRDRRAQNQAMDTVYALAEMP